MRRIGLSVALVMSAAALGSPAKAAPSGDTVEMKVEARSEGPFIDRQIFGQFAEHLGFGIYGGVWVGKDSPIPNVRGIRKDVVAALKDIKVPNVRWPGGCFGDEYHWRDGVGPVEGRRSTVNANWGNAGEPNTFGTDEFMDFVDQIGAEAYVSINIGSGTVQEAADWLAYMTAPVESSAGKERAANGHPEPYKVRYLGLGNESWSCGGAMRPEYYTDLMKRYARFVRNYRPEQMENGAEPMQRIAVGPSDGDTAYTEQVMKTWTEHDWSWNIEGLSLHHYTHGGWPPSLPSTGFGKTDYARLVKETLMMDDLIVTHSTIMDKYDPEKKIPLVIDEWGVWLAPAPGTNPGFLIQQNSLRDGIMAALNLNIFARHADRVRMTNIAQMVNVLQAMILTEDEKMVLTPTYHVFKMYVPFQDARFVPVTFDAGTYREGDIELPRVDGIAARDKEGRLWLAVTNVDPDRKTTVSVTFDGMTPKSAKGQVLTAPEVSSVNTFEKPDTVSPKPITGTARGGGITLELPAKSVAVVQVGG